MQNYLCNTSFLHYLLLNRVFISYACIIDYIVNEICLLALFECQLVMKLYKFDHAFVLFFRIEGIVKCLLDKVLITG